jgi:hypothetical protein
LQAARAGERESGHESAEEVLSDQRGPVSVIQQLQSVRLRRDHAKMTTAFLDQHTLCLHILETGKDSYRFNANAEKAKQSRKETPALTTS